MGPDLFRIKLLTLLAGVAAVFLLAYLAQRVWYWWRSRRIDVVETSSFSRIKDPLALGVALVMVLLTWGGRGAARGLETFVDASEGALLREFEVVEQDGRTITVIVYPATRRSRTMPEADTFARSGSARDEGIVVADREGFRVTVQEVRFNRLMRAFGQRDLAAVLDISSATTSAERGAAAPGSRITLSPGRDAGWLSWLYVSSERTVVLESARDPARGDVFALRRGPEGELLLERVMHRDLE